MLPSFRKLNLLLLVTFPLWILILVGEYNRVLQKQITTTHRIEVIEKTKNVQKRNIQEDKSEEILPPYIMQRDKSKEILRMDTILEDKSEEILSLNKTFEDKSKEILPMHRTLDDKSKEILPVHSTLEDKSEEILPLDIMQRDKSKEILPMDTILEEKSEEISLMDRVLEDKSEEILPTEILFEGTSEEILPAELPFLTPALIEKARNELGETEELKQTALAEFRKMIEAEEDLVSPTDDVFLLSFLRKNQYDVTEAFELLQRFWYLKVEYAYLFEPVDVDAVASVYSYNTFGFLPYRDRQGCVIFFDKVGLWDPEKVPFKLRFQAVVAVMTHFMEYEANQIAGYRLIIDLRGVGWAQMKYMTPSILLLMVKASQYSFPVRYRGVHILSEDKMINFFWTVFQPFMPTDLKEMMLFHGEDLKPIQQYIHPSILPEEFRGLAPTHSNAVWYSKISENKDRVLSLMNSGYMLE